MTEQAFEEWWEWYWGKEGQPEYFDYPKPVGQHAWQAATKRAAENYERIRLYESKCSVITETLESKWPCGDCEYCAKAQKIRGE